MRAIFSLCFLLIANLAWAGNTTFYDVINNTELVFTNVSRYEKLENDGLNPLDEVGYSFFTFQNEEYEKLRLENIHEKFKKRPLETSFKQVAEAEAKRYFDLLVDESNYYRRPEYQGYVVDDISLRPLSYLGNTLTFSLTVELALKNIDREEVTMEEVYYLNLDDFAITPAREIHHHLDYAALRKALISHWEEIQNEMPEKNWAPLQSQEKRKLSEYKGQIRDSAQSEFYSDSLVSYAVHAADLEKAEILYTGAGVLVVLKDATPWFTSKYGRHPLQVKLHLNSHEAKEALRDFAPYRDLQKATPYRPEKLPVDPFERGNEASYVNLSRDHLDILQLEDPDILAIEKFYRDNPNDSQYIYRVDYEKGRAQFINRSSRHNIPVYDSIIWEDGKVKGVVFQRAGRNYNGGNVYEPQRNLQLQHRDENGNTRWFLTTEHNFSMRHYCYFEGKVATYSYTLLSAAKYSDYYRQNPNWFQTVSNGLCDENDKCYKVDDQGRIVVSYNDYYAYQNGKLVQILGERERSTLFYYDEQGRLSEVINGTGSGGKIQYHYEDDARLPNRIERHQENQNHSKNHHLIYHY